jgi:hypothetical protein
VQAALALVAVALLVARAGELLLLTSQHSLWGDEIVSVERFSGQGLAVCLSDYTIPNNHVLFNAINSVLPGAGSFDPLRARIVSFVAVTLGLLVACFALIRRKAWLVLLAFSIAYLGDYRLLGVHLGARGYGMLGCMAVLVCLLVWQHLENEKQRWPLVALAVSVVVGALTVPTFLFFGGSVLLALFCLRPSRAHFFTGLIVFVVTAGYWAWMYLSNHGTGGPNEGFFEGEFHQLSAPLTLIELFSLEGWPAVLRYLAIGLAIVAPWLVPAKSSGRTAALSLWFGVVGSLVICLIMKRPLLHTVAHLLIPAGFLIGFGIRALAFRWQKTWRFAPLGLVLVMALAATAAALRPRDAMHRWPTESWQEIAGMIEAIRGCDADDASPAGKSPSVWAPYRSNNLAVYLDANQRFDRAYDEDAFRSGEQLVVASPHSKYPEEKVDAAIVDAAAVRFRVRQKAHGFQEIAWNPPTHLRAAVVSAKPKPGTSSGKTTVLRLQPPADLSADAVLYLYSDDPIHSKPPLVTIREADGQSKKGKALALGPLWAVRMSAANIVEIEAVYYAGTAGDQPPGFVAWFGSGLPDDHVGELLTEAPPEPPTNSDDHEDLK